MTTQTDQIQHRQQRLALWPIRWKTALLLISLLLLLWLGVKAWRIGRAASSLLAQQETAQTLAASGLGNIDPDMAEAMILDMRHDVVVIKDETAFLLPLSPYLGWVPKAGPLLVATPQLVEMADAGSESAVYAIESIKPMLVILQAPASGSSQLPQLVNALAEARQGLSQASRALERVAMARAAITNLDDFPERLKPLFALADEWLPLAQDSLTMVQILPDILGQNGRRTYLLLAQNEDEIRATGGFISGIGTLTVEDGQILDLAFQDASSYDLGALFADRDAYDLPPLPLQTHMGSDYFLLRDANYWPDFPYSARKAIELYRLVTPDAQIDGLFAIDQQFMALLVAATGPVTVETGAAQISADNTIDSFRNSFNIKEGQTTEEWFRNRKAFLSTFSSAIINKIETDFGSVDPIALIKNMHFALSARHLQLFLTDPQETAVLQNLGWDGRLENPTGQDFLLVLDTNVGFNKTNMHIQRQINYDVKLEPNAQSQASLTINYTHTNPANGQPCIQETTYENAPTYQEVADQCYFNFLRVYVPAQSTLTSSTLHVIPENILLSGNPWQETAVTSAEFADFTTFSNLLMVPRAESLISSMTYSLPPTVVQTDSEQHTYQLLLRKQAGTNSEIVTFTVTLPEGSRVISATPAPTAVTQDGMLHYSFTLTTDKIITISFK